MIKYRGFVANRAFFFILEATTRHLALIVLGEAKGVDFLISPKEKTINI